MRVPRGGRPLLPRGTELHQLEPIAAQPDGRGLLVMRALRRCRWRQYRGGKCDFTLLDRNGRSGWDLATKLLRPRDKFNRWGAQKGFELQRWGEGRGGLALGGGAGVWRQQCPWQRHAHLGPSPCVPPQGAADSGGGPAAQVLCDPRVLRMQRTCLGYDTGVMW